MEKYLLFAAVATIIAQTQARNTPVLIENPKLGPTYNELLFILQSRHGMAGMQPKHLTPCARAILGCCNNKAMNDTCSENLKCGAHFFDDNPCEDKFIIDALEAAKLFYEQFNAVASA
ncbi:jg14778, partial [Pararge aegeria aegeria]